MNKDLPVYTSVTDITVDTDTPETVKDLDLNTRLGMFDKKYLSVLMKIRDLNEQKKELEDKLNEVKESIGVAMEKYDLQSISTSGIRITRIKPSTTISFDTSKLKKENPELFEELFNKYHKTSNRSAYTKIET